MAGGAGFRGSLRFDAEESSELNTRTSGLNCSRSSITRFAVAVPRQHCHSGSQGDLVVNDHKERDSPSDSLGRYSPRVSVAPEISAGKR